MIKIAVDKHVYTRNPSSGMGVYIEKVTEALQKDKKISLTLLDFQPKNEKSIIGKIYNLLREQFIVNAVFPIRAKENNIDLFFAPNPPVPFFLSKPIVLTIPDMSFYYDPTLGNLIKAYLFVTYFLSAKKAKTIMTFSESSKRDIVKLLKIRSIKVHVTPLGVNKIVSKLKPLEVLPKFGIAKKYILGVPGTYIPRKNMGDLLSAYKSLPASLRQKYLLVLVGNTKDQYYTDFWKTVKRAKLTGNVICTGYVSREELGTLYKEATVFAFPSLYEGFGLPPLEAMSAGIPTIVYNRSSLQEVVGEAAFLVDNTKELAKGLNKLLIDSKLRSQLIAKGHVQSRKFTWARSTKNILSIIKTNAATN